MNRAAFQIQLSDDLRDLLDTWGGDVGAIISEGIRKGLDLANRKAVGIIKVKRLTGTGPFPVSQNRLGHVSRNLIRNFDAAPARILDAAKGIVTASMGSNVKYFGGHEFGFSGSVQVKAHTQQVDEHDRRTPSGGTVRVKSHTRNIGAHTRQLKVPERRPVRAELATRSTQDIYDKEITAGVSAALEGST